MSFSCADNEVVQVDGDEGCRELIPDFLIREEVPQIGTDSNLGYTFLENSIVARRNRK